ncbi:MAG: hypothetical protein ACKKMO_01125 [Candidatus Nealsonbacteria bacterium]
MAYKRFGGKLYKKVKGKWTKKKNYPTINKARRAMERLRGKKT